MADAKPPVAWTPPIRLRDLCVPGLVITGYLGGLSFIGGFVTTISTGKIEAFLTLGLIIPGVLGLGCFLMTAAIHALYCGIKGGFDHYLDWLLGAVRPRKSTWVHDDPYFAQSQPGQSLLGACAGLAVGGSFGFLGGGFFVFIGLGSQPVGHSGWNVITGMGVLFFATSTLGGGLIGLSQWFAFRGEQARIKRKVVGGVLPHDEHF